MQTIAHQQQDILNELRSVSMLLCSIKDNRSATESMDNLPAASLEFLSDNNIRCGEKTKRFTPSSYDLLKLFVDSGLFLTKEDICSQVLLNEESSRHTLDNCVHKARKELRTSGFPYRINTLPHEGYELISCDNITKNDDVSRLPQGKSKVQ